MIRNLKLIIGLVAVSACMDCYCGCAAFAFDTSVTVRMKSANVKVFKPLVTISDIAEISSENEELVRVIGNLDLDFIEDDKKLITVSSQQLRMRIRIAGISDARVDVRGPSTLTVQRSARSHPAKTIRQTIADSIARQFGVEPSDVRVSLIDDVLTNRFTELAQNLETAIVVLPADLPLGEIKVRIIYKTEFENDKSTELDCRITMMQEMLIAKKHLPRGTTISATDVRTVKRPLEDNRLIPASLAQIVGKQTNSNIPMHSVVRTSNLANSRKQYVVKRNDIVDVLVASGGLNIRMKAKVLTPGYEGDSVQVLNTDSDTKLTASVVNKSLVEIR